MDNYIYVFLLSNQHIFIVYPLLTRGYLLEQADTEISGLMVFIFWVRGRE